MVFSKEFENIGAHTWKAQELKTSFVIRTVRRRLLEVERRSLDRSYSIERSDKYDGVLEDRILCVSKDNLYVTWHFTGSQ